MTTLTGGYDLAMEMKQKSGEPYLKPMAQTW
jgi:hypothetical protein